MKKLTVLEVALRKVACKTCNEESQHGLGWKQEWCKNMMGLWKYLKHLMKEEK